MRRWLASRVSAALQQGMSRTKTHRTKQVGWLHFLNVAGSWPHESVSLTVCPCVSMLVFRSSKLLTLWQRRCDGTRSRFFEVRFARACTCCAAPDPSLRAVCRATLDPKRRREIISSLEVSVFGDVRWLDVDSRVTQKFRVQPMLSIHSQFAESSLHCWLLSCCLFLKLCPRPDAILGREDKMDVQRQDFVAHICYLPGCAHLVALADAFEREPDDQSKPRQSRLCVANHRANMSTK